MVLTAPEEDVAVALHAHQLLQRLARHQDRVFDRPFELVRRLDERQAVAVGRHQLDRLRLDLEERSGELEPRILARDREEDLSDQTAQAPERHLHLRLALDRRQRRKVGRRQAVHAEAGLACLDEEGPVVLDLEPHLFRDDGAHDLGELLGLDGEGAFALDLGRDRAGQRDVEIGGRELEVLARGPEEDVRQTGIVVRRSTIPCIGLSSARKRSRRRRSSIA